METRRAVSTTWRTSPDIEARPPASRSQSGMTIWFDTIVETAMAATMTIDVAEEKPPRKDRTARLTWPSDSGSVTTKRSGLAPAGRRSRPVAAIGTTKIDIRSR